MKELLSSNILTATMPADVGQAVLFACALLLVGLFGVAFGTATERGRTRQDLQDVFTDPETAKAIFVARWTVAAPNYMATYVEELWDGDEEYRQESEAVAHAIHELVTDELGL